MRPSPVIVTEFEVQVRKLGLMAPEYVSSPALKSWCERNRNRVYVPEWLLKEWDMRVYLNFQDAA